MSFSLRIIAPACILFTLVTASSVAQVPRPLIQIEPANAVYSVAFSADGSLVAGGGRGSDYPAVGC